MAQLAYHVSKGLPLWGCGVRRGVVLYMALEDDYPRLQGRLYRMFGEDSAADLHLSIYAKQLNSGAGTGGTTKEVCPGTPGHPAYHHRHPAKNPGGRGREV
ncbi:MAG: hypothetical protein V8S11_09305 [Flavonifractor plautii]